MKPGAIFLLSFGAQCAVGLPLIGAPPLSRYPALTRLALASTAGLFMTSTVMTAMSGAGLHWRVGVVLVLSVVVSTAVSILLRSLATPTNYGATDQQPYGAFYWASMVICAAGVALSALSVIAGASTSADLLLFWGPKAWAFAQAQGVDVRFLGDPSVSYMHISYPPLVTNSYALSSVGASRFPWGAATATFPLCLGFLAVGLPGLVESRSPKHLSCGAAAWVVCALALVGSEVDIAGSAEMFLLLFETLAIGLTLTGELRLPASQLFLGILLGGAASTKVEGVTFAVALSGFLAVGASKRARVAFLARTLGPTLVSLGLWFAIGLRHHLFVGYNSYGPLETVYPGALALTVAAMVAAIWVVGYGGPFILSLAMCISSPRRVSPLLGVALVLVGFLLYTYIHVPDPTLWIDWSAARVLSPLIPLLSLAALGERRPDDGMAGLAT